MSELLFVTETASFNRSSLGTISGVVAFRVADEFFPATGWNDLAVAVTTAWLEALVRIAREETRSERVRFMDGPFWADLLRAENGIVVDLVESRLMGDVSRYHMSVNLRDVLSNAVSTAAEMLHECRVRGWEDADLVKLDQMKQEARKMLKEANAG
jgi:hypothetical protein